MITSNDSDAPFATYLRRLPTEHQYSWTAADIVTQSGAPAGDGGGGSGGPTLPAPIAQWHLNEGAGTSAQDVLSTNHETMCGKIFEI